jgi:tetratricopeptide (TPR) repeat protein
MPAIFLRLTLLFSLVAASLVALAGEQYRSRMYIDIEQDATENVALSVSELEKQLDTLQDNNARASAEKFLAQHYVAEKDYPKAIARLEDALRQPGQNDKARCDLLGELARLYVLQKDYDHAEDALKQLVDLQPPENADLYFLLAQLQYRNKHYVESTAAVDKALALEKNPSDDQLQTALAIYYSTGDYKRCAQVMQQRVGQDINNAMLWQQWVSLELKAGNPAQALTTLSLAWEKGVPFRDQDILLLCDLYTINKIPARGARVLEQAMKSGRVPDNSKMNDRLFRLWLQAGDRDKAQLALEKAAQQGDDKDLQLHLAQLYMEKEQWQAMQDIVLKACTTPLPDALVSRANLLLGISQLKLGATEPARRSFINATLTGGENDKAGQWLAYMKAEPTTEREKLGVSGSCYSNSTRSIWNR